MCEQTHLGMFLACEQAFAMDLITSFEQVLQLRIERLLALAVYTLENRFHDGGLVIPDVRVQAVITHDNCHKIA
jgi:hypothetical protein